MMKNTVHGVEFILIVTQNSLLLVILHQTNPLLLKLGPNHPPYLRLRLRHFRKMTIEVQIKKST